MTPSRRKHEAKRQVVGRIALALACACVLANVNAHAQPPASSDAACVKSFEDAQKLRTHRKLVAAKREMIQCGQERCPGPVRVKCVEWLADVERALPSLLVAVKDRTGRDTVDVELAIDGVVVTHRLDGTPVALDPGPHKVRVQLPNERPLEHEIVVQEGERYRKLLFNFRPAQQAHAPIVPPAWTGGGVAVPMLPNELPYDEGAPIPAGYEKDTRIRKGLVIAGAVVFGTFWLTSIIAGAAIASDPNTANEPSIPLYIPIGGPFAAIATLNARGSGMALLIIDGVVQTGGAAMFIAGLAAQQTYLKRKIARDIELAPSGAGLMLRGSF